MPRTITNEKSAAPVASPPADKPEWLRISDATFRFGLSKATLYNLIHDGKVKSCAPRLRNGVKPTRLISYDSLSALIEGGDDSTPYQVGVALNEKPASRNRKPKKRAA